MYVARGAWDEGRRVRLVTSSCGQAKQTLELIASEVRETVMLLMRQMG
jgi:hypothetical protein